MAKYFARCLTLFASLAAFKIMRQDMQCRLEIECARLEKDLEIERSQVEEWRGNYHKQRQQNEEWVERWFDRLGEHGFVGSSLEQRMVALEGAYLALSKEAAKPTNNNGSTPCPFFSRSKVPNGNDVWTSVPWCNHGPSQRAVP